MSTDSKDVIRRRQRGERRIDQIVEAAAAVFAECGYERATTNAIAATAGISPGSLYQFFRNKEEIAGALAIRYGAIFEAALDQAFVAEVASLSTEAMINRIVDTLVSVNVAHPALRTVFRGWDAPPALNEAIKPLQASILARVTAIVARRLPRSDTKFHDRIASVTMELFRGLVPLVLLSNDSERIAYTQELKRALRAYIESVEATFGEAVAS